LADEQLSSLEKTQQPQSELQVVLTPLPEISGMNEVDLQDLPLEEIIPADTSLGEITLNKPEQIYYELYRKTKQKAKETLLEAKRIKEQYQLDVSDLDDSDEDDDDEEEEL
jgi:cell fate regulator YaaT (PSP1 superfamily)